MGENEPEWMIRMKELRERNKRRPFRQSNQWAEFTKAMVNQMNLEMPKLLEDSSMSDSSCLQGKEVATFNSRVASSFYSDHPIIEEFVPDDNESQAEDEDEEVNQRDRSIQKRNSISRRSSLSLHHNSNHPIIEEISIQQRHSISRRNSLLSHRHSDTPTIDKIALENSPCHKGANVSTPQAESTPIEHPASDDEDPETQHQGDQSARGYHSISKRGSLSLHHNSNHPIIEEFVPDDNESEAEDEDEEVNQRDRSIQKRNSISRRSSLSLHHNSNHPIIEEISIQQRHSISRRDSSSMHQHSNLPMIDKIAPQNKILYKRVSGSSPLLENYPNEHAASDNEYLGMDQQGDQSIQEHHYISERGSLSLHHDLSHPMIEGFVPDNDESEAEDVEMDQQERSNQERNSISRRSSLLLHQHSKSPTIGMIASENSIHLRRVDVSKPSNENYPIEDPASDNEDSDMDQQGAQSIQERHSISKRGSSTLHHDSNRPTIDKIAPQNKIHHNGSSRLPGIQPVRRSTRPRWKPLEFWRGERPKYVRDGETFTYVSTQPGRPEHDYSRKQPRRCKSPSKLQSRVSLQECKIPSGCVVPPNYEFQKSRTGEFDLISTDLNGMILGKLIIGPGKRKQEAKISINLTYILFVLRGRVILKNKTPKTVKYYIDDSPLRSHITLKGGTSYSITNVGKDEAHILYMTRITEDL